MSAARAAFCNLVYIAKVDRHISDAEVSLLRRYGAALDLPEVEVEELLEARRIQLPDPAEFTETPQERQHLLRMLMRVALADGKLTGREKQRLKAVAQALQIRRLAFAEQLVAVRDEMGVRSRVRRWPYLALVGAAALVGGLLLTYENLSTASEASGRQLDQLEARIDEDEAARLAEARKMVEESNAAFAALEARLETKLAELRSAQGTSQTEDYARQKGALEMQLVRRRDARESFADIESRLAPATLLIRVSVPMRRGSERKTWHSMGTGFFVSEDGIIVTNLHVVRPWLFKDRLIRRIKDGWEVDEEAVSVGAWPPGVEVLRAGRWNTATGWTSYGKTLGVLRTGPEVLGKLRRHPGAEGKSDSRNGIKDYWDLALLQASVTDPVPFVSLAEPGHRVAKIDPVMLLGYPAGITMRDSARADTAPALGEVRRVGEAPGGMIFITAPVFPGNSGGPLVAVDGTAIGVAACSYGGQTLGGCIPVAHVRSLLDDL